jgi:hypothetical protein
MQDRSSNPYYEYILKLARKLPKDIYDPTRKREKPPMPTQASSDFLINKNLGDWGENVVLRSISAASKDYVVVKYGRSGDAVAGEEGFREFYNNYQDELDEFGKRPDLLVFKKNDFTSEDRDLSERDNEEIAGIVGKAVAGIEVRSSSYLARRYKPGRSSPFPVLSFTIKVEDIMVVLRWIQNTGVPHYYVQVPFDEVYALGFHAALETICGPDSEKGEKNYSLARDSKNQFKTTIKIPFTRGRRVGEITEDPKLIGVRRELDSGRLLFSVKFSGGVLEPRSVVWEEIFEETGKLKAAPPS